MNTDSHDQVAPPHPASPLRMRDELKAAVDAALPQTPGQFGEQLIKEKWGADIDPQTALLVTLDYDYRGHPAQNGIHQGQVGSSRSLLQTLLSNYQTVGDGRFGETAFGLYTPPDVGPAVRLVENVDEFAENGSGNHRTYEGIYRRRTPQAYGPETQLKLRPADFKKWVWKLDLKYLYENYLDKAWPSDEVLIASRPYALRTSVKAAFVMSVWLQHHENCLSTKGLELAMRAARLPVDQTWEALTIDQLQAPTHLPASVEAGRLKLYRYTARDIWCYRDRSSDRVLLYIPGNSSPLHEFANRAALRQWLVEQGKAAVTKQALAAHFADEDREDGTFHAGVLSAFDGMAVFPRQHHLTKESGFFNDDGYWDPADYIGVDLASSSTDPFAQLVLTMKQAAIASNQTIRDDADVNRANLSAFVEPIVQWVNQFGPLALFLPGGEGLLVLAGLIDAGYGIDQAVNGESASQRSQGVARTVFGLLNALPLANGVGSLGKDGEELVALTKVERDSDGSSGPIKQPVPSQATSLPQLPLPTRVELLRGVGAPAGTFTDEALAQIGKVSAVDDDMLRLMQSGRAPTPLLGDTVDRFRIDQEVTALGDPSTAQAEFNRRYQALQQSEHEWVKLFQRTYPDLPKAAVEQMLDRYGVDFTASPDPVLARELFKQLDSKARQYQQHVRLNRAYEGLYLRSVTSAESDTLALHSLRNLPGWPRSLRIEVLDGSLGGRVLDGTGPIDSPATLRLIKVQERYQPYSLTDPTAATTDFYEALASVLSREERSALQVLSADHGAELKLKISDHVLSRSELATGLGRMKSGLAFEPRGLKGGGFPGTPQDEALTQAIKRVQLREVYPELTDVDADVELARVGNSYVAHIDQLKIQLQQLISDMNNWVDRVALDINDMSVPLLNPGHHQAAGMNAAQLAAHNAGLVQEVMAFEVESRMELAGELVSIWRKRSPQPHSRYSGNHVTGFTIDLDHENFHRLPALSVRLNDVVGLNMHNFQMSVISSLDEFLEAFPNVETLDLSDVDLRFDLANGQQDSELPVMIPELKRLTSLSLRSTHLKLSELNAGKLSELTHLQTLDMSDNPLGDPPLVMGMNQLRHLNLENTGITRCPVGIMEYPYLTMLNLRDNQISRVPQVVLNQAIARDRVLLWGNPITDEDTLQRLVTHREQTGINLWLSAPGNNYSNPAAWLNGLDAAHENARLQIWQRLSLRQRGGRFLGALNKLTLTADFQVNYLNLQARVWRLLTEADASDELWGRLSQDVRLPAGAFDNPFAVFTVMEDRARLYNDWVALGRPFPAGGEAS
ncbi:dermonecrotic toxin domain-containing protein [Pseudomonas sp. Irchel s3h14]|uniref:leucine-rich repeat domain-containing protein n=1 Tax=Pseudomonas sp. Irchel s3h14 TaxID=2009179 RepID=UPI000BA45A44